AERRRLERDLHDGAQQRLVAMSLALGLLRSRLHSDGDRGRAALLDEAEAELHGAVAELREVAHGIHPAVLTDEGLAAALESLAEQAPAALRLARVPRERFPASVETAAYLVVAEAAKLGPARVTASRRDGYLVVDVETESVPERLGGLEDRIGALDGSLTLVQAPGRGVMIRAEIPCAY
ncbi:MAG: histidine kinase, partial [Actinomycetota bacterium]|nr:histidine kinase [Actinomycetota bacterium]